MPIDQKAIEKRTK